MSEKKNETSDENTYAVGPKRDAVLTFRGDVGQGAYRMSVVLKALCEDDMDSGSSLGDLQMWVDGGDIKIGYTA